MDQMNQVTVVLTVLRAAATRRAAASIDGSKPWTPGEWRENSWYPLVNIEKNAGTSPLFMGKSTISMTIE
jgi:hypothetical protein